MKDSYLRFCKMRECIGIYVRLCRVFVINLYSVFGYFFVDVVFVEVEFQQLYIYRLSFVIQKVDNLFFLLLLIGLENKRIL